MKTVDVEFLDYCDEEVVRRIVEKYAYSPLEALSLFLNSETYRMVANPDLAMWEFGPGGIFDMWETERITGTPRRSAYLRVP